jgi:hypothetical protein
MEETLFPIQKHSYLVKVCICKDKQILRLSNNSIQIHYDDHEDYLITKEQVVYEINLKKNKLKKCEMAKIMDHGQHKKL